MSLGSISPNLMTVPLFYLGEMNGKLFTWKDYSNFNKQIKCFSEFLGWDAPNTTIQIFLFDTRNALITGQLIVMCSFPTSPRLLHSIHFRFRLEVLRVVWEWVYFRKTKTGYKTKIRWTQCGRHKSDRNNIIYNKQYIEEQVLNSKNNFSAAFVKASQQCLKTWCVPSISTFWNCEQSSRMVACVRPIIVLRLPIERSILSLISQQIFIRTIFWGSHKCLYCCLCRGVVRKQVRFFRNLINCILATKKLKIICTSFSVPLLIIQ